MKRTAKVLAAAALASFLLTTPTAMAKQSQTCRQWCFSQCAALYPGDPAAIEACFEACDSANCYT